MSITVTELINHPVLRRAYTHLVAHDAETIDLQAAISAIAAPSGQEERRAGFIAQALDAAGLEEVQRDAVGNVVGHWRRGTGDPLVLVAHLDTVFGPEVDVGVRRDGRRLAGPGISDNARGLACLVRLADLVASASCEPERPLVFAATVGEEGAGDLKGAKHLLGDAGIRPALVIALDGAGADRIVHRALGCRRLRFTFRGPGGHSWSANGVANPAHAAGAFAASVADLPRPQRPRTTCSVVRLHGGMGLNSIPQTAWVDVDTRSEDHVVLQDVVRELRVRAGRAAELEDRRRAARTPPLALDIESLGDRPAGATPETHPLVQAAVEATRAIGREPELAAASTDANIAIARRVPAIAIGAGGSAGDVHLTSEWYDNDGGPEGIYRALLVTAAAAGLRS